MELKEVIDVLQKMVEKADGKEFIALRTAIDAVIQVRAFEVADSGRWVDVNDREPSEVGMYLVTLKSNSITVSMWTGKGNAWLPFGDVVAWQTLPEPYNRKEKR